MHARRVWIPALLALTGCAHSGPSPLLTLRRVVLNQSGSGYFERSGRVTGDRLALRLKTHEVDDVLATLTVLEQGPTPRQTVVAAGVPHATQGGREETVSLDLRLPDARPRDLMVAYAVPTANWQATYRVVLPDHEGSPALLQVWALVHNSSDEDWNHVEMTLATGAPLSFAFHLRTPSFTARPDATTTMQTSVVDAPVLSEESERRERDRSIAFASTEADDVLRGGIGGGSDGEHRRHAAGADRDGDGIADASDRCPTDPETFNGAQDDDGCPDVGRVQVSSAALQILQSVLFDAGSFELRPAGVPVLESVASTLRGNPSVQLLELQGNASADEPDPWNLALNRAAAVRARLVSMGVSADRLRVRSFGTSHPVASNDAPEGRGRNRYVGFSVVSAPPGESAARTGAAVTVATMRGSGPDNATTHEFMGATRYVVSAPVSIAASTAALVTLASREVPGEDVYLYRPESAAPSSRQHPYRAARLRNHTGMTLLPGPVALFSGGTFAGEGLLQRLADDETTFIPYAIDPSTEVAVQTEDVREPAHVVSVIRNVVTLEDIGVHRTRYTIDPGAQAPSHLYLRHEHLDGYTPRNLPPESESGRGADLVPVPLTARRQSVVALEQTHPVRYTLSLVEDITTDVAPYLAHTSERLRAPLRSALDQRNALAQAERQAEEIREQLSDVAQRNAELRETLRTLQSVTDAARVELRTRMTRQLQESMGRLATLSRELDARTANASTLRTGLIEALRGMRLEEQSPPESGDASAAATPSHP